MINKIKLNISSIKNNLSSLEGVPIGKMTLTIVILLDFFILSSIFEGLDEHTRQLQRVDDYVPSVCRSIVLTDNWSQNKIIDSLVNYIPTKKYVNNKLLNEKYKDKSIHPTCIQFDTLLTNIKNNKLMIEDLRLIKSTKSNINDANRKLNKLRPSYNTELLGVIAKRNTNNSTALEVQINNLTKQINTYSILVSNTENKIKSNPVFTSLNGTISQLTEQEKKILSKDYNTLLFWFPVKRFLMELVFLLPIFGMFYALNNYGVKREKPYIVLISSHLMVVVFIPVFFKIFEMVYEIIPHKLLGKLIDFLYSFNLMAIWYYLMMALSIGFAIFVIWLFQKKLFSPEKTARKRLSNGECPNCGIKGMSDKDYCWSCGTKQKISCKWCNEETFINSFYCIKCGSDLNTKEKQ